MVGETNLVIAGTQVRPPFHAKLIFETIAFPRPKRHFVKWKLAYEPTNYRSALSFLVQFGLTAEMSKAKFHLTIACIPIDRNHLQVFATLDNRILYLESRGDPVENP